MHREKTINVFKSYDECIRECNNINIPENVVKDINDKILLSSTSNNDKIKYFSIIISNDIHNKYCNVLIRGLNKKKWYLVEYKIAENNEYEYKFTNWNYDNIKHCTVM
jgi:tyrosine-protein phosphatase YwqE